MRLNFWDIQYDPKDLKPKHLIKSLLGFEDVEQTRLLNALENFMEKKKEYLIYFVERVTDEIAPDYRCIIPQDMYLTLIRDRLINSYYRSSE